MRWTALCIVALCAGCAGHSNTRMTAEDGQQIGNLMACALAPRSCTNSSPPQHYGSPGGAASTYFVYGGRNHDVFLGCLTCDAYSLNSIRNPDGPHGATYAAQSVRNHTSPYGSSYSNTSACNQTAGNPPVIVDQRGHYYGRLTLNPYRDQLQRPEIINWLARACQY